MEDMEFMKIAIAESKKSSCEDGRIHPRVGAVIVKDGKILATAYRGEFSGSHAEYIALKKLDGVNLEGAVVYTTLEPCTSRSYPKVSCAERLVRAKVGHVVIGMLDPNPDISGKGVRLLRQSNIKISLFTDDLMKEVEEINHEFDKQFEKVRLASDKQDLESFQQMLDGIYGDVNSKLSPEYIYSYLHRSTDFLISNIAKDSIYGNRENRVNTVEFIRVFSWLFTLASKLGCRMQKGFFNKFPDCCPYCLEPSCQCHDTGKMPKPRMNALRQPVTLSPAGIEAVLNEKYDNIRGKKLNFDHAIETINNIYPYNRLMWRKAGPNSHLFKLIEELAEVHEAIGKFTRGEAPSGTKLIEEELADVLAWLLSAWDLTFKGTSLDAELFNYYFTGCPICKKNTCECSQYSGRSVNIIDHNILNPLSGLLRQLQSLIANEAVERLISSVAEADKIHSDGRTRLCISEINYQIGVLEKQNKCTTINDKEALTIINKILRLTEPVARNHSETYYQC